MLKPIQDAGKRRAGKGQEDGGCRQIRPLSPLLISVFLALATFLVFLPVVRNGFVNYDDPDYITANPHVQGGLTWNNVVWAFKTGHASNWHPITWLSHILDCQIFGLHAPPQHLVSVGFHVANVVLLFLLLRLMTGAFWRSVVLAALFALHPLRVESVAWISERKDVLSTLFLLLTLMAYTKYVESREKRENGDRGAAGPELAKERKGRGTRAETRHASLRRMRRPASLYYVLALVLFSLGLMSKPMLVTAPFLLLLLDYWPLGRVALRSRPKGGAPDPSGHDSTREVSAAGSASILRLVLEKIPFLVLAAASSVVTFLVQRKGGAVSTSLTFGQRIANALVSYVRYIGKTLWPTHLSVLYPHPIHWPLWEVIGAALILMAVFWGVLAQARKRPYLAVGWLWFFGTLVPVIGLVQVGVQSMADRYTYVPTIGSLIMLVWGVNDLIPRRAWKPAVMASGTGLTLLACAALTMRQIGFWKDSETLFRHAIQVTRNNYLAYNNLGFFLSNKGKTREAMQYYEKSLAINPNYDDALNNVGYALAKEHRSAEAIPYYEAALRGRPNNPEVHNNLGNALSEVGKLDEAIQQYLITLQENPDHADAHNNLGIALAMKGKLDEAIEHFRQAIRLKPRYASAHSNLGNALAAEHRLAEAMKEYQECLRLDPSDARAHNNLGNVLAEQGDLEAAVAQYNDALRLNEDNPEAEYNLGAALAKLGRNQEAAAHFQQALRLKPDYLQARRQLEQMRQRLERR